jgi:hypothetical protein
MEAAIAKAWSDGNSPIAVNLPSEDSVFSPVVNGILSEARRLEMSQESIASWAQSDLLKTIRGESRQLQPSLNSLVPCLRELVIRNPHLIDYTLKVDRPKQILNSLCIFEANLPTPSFEGAVELSEERALAAFRRARAVAKGESPIRSHKKKIAKSKAPTTALKDETIPPPLIELDESTQDIFLPTLKELMDQGLSQTGAETVLIRLKDKFGLE